MLPLHGPQSKTTVPPSEPAAAEGTGLPSADPFVGREKELRQLESCLECIEGRFVVVTGPAGIGKTRLAQEFAADAIARGRRVLRGACWEGEGAPAFWPFVLVLRHYLAGAEEPTPDSRASGDLDELLTRCLGARSRGSAHKGHVAADPQQARFELFDRYAAVLGELAAKQPSAIILDDVHWADASSLLLLQFLASALAEIPILLLVTSRDPLPALLSAACRHPWTHQVPLNGLNAGEARALLHGRTAPLSRPEVIDKLTALTDGNPFFLKELAHWLEDSPSELGPDWPRTLPASLRGLTLHQFEALSLPCRSLLRVASVVGREFDPELLAEVLKQPATLVLDLFQEAFNKRVVAPIGPTTYRFTHALVREAIYDNIHLTERAQLHEQIALTLEQRGACGTDSLGAIGHHLFLALPLVTRAKASSAAIAAAQEAQRICAYEDAVSYLRRALRLCDSTTTEAEHCDLLLLLGAAEAASGDWTSSRHTFHEAATIARRLDSADRFSRAAIGFKGVMLATIPVDTEAVILLEEACERARGHDVLLIELLAALTGSLHFSDDQTLPTRYACQALSLANRLGDERLRAIAIQARALSLWQPDHLTDVIRLSSQLNSLGIRLGDRFLQFQATIFRHSALLVFGKIDESDYELSKAARLATASRHPRLEWQVTAIQAARALIRGPTQEAHDLTLRAHELGQRVHDSTPAHYEMIQAFQVALLHQNLQRWPDIASAVIGRFPTVVGYRAAAALMYARLGMLPEARHHLQLFANVDFRNIPSNSAALWLLAMLGEASTLCGSFEWTHTIYRRLLPYAFAQIAVAWGILLDGSTSHYLGIMAAALQIPDAARRHFADALRANSLLKAPPLVARTQLEYARLLSSHFHETTLAVELATLAHHTFRIYDLTCYATQAADLATLAGRHGQPLSGEHAELGHDLPSSGQYPSSNSAAQDNTLRRQGDYWLITFRGRSAYLRHSVGLEYLKRILAADGSPVHVLDLLEHLGAPYTGEAASSASASTLSDAPARQQYRARLLDLQQDLEAAERANDLGARERLALERDMVTRELCRAYGIRGRRRASPLTERARISVRNRITTALRSIQRQNDPAYQHLSRSIHTGVLCSYRPEYPTSWTL